MKYSSYQPSDYSLHSLLDYDKSDKKERVFEVSLFCELYKELLQRHFAILILKALIEAEGNCEVKQTSVVAKCITSIVAKYIASIMAKCMTSIVAKCITIIVAKYVATL